MGTRGPHSHEGVPNLPVEWGPGVPNIPVDWGRGPHSTGRLGTRGPQNRGSPKYRDNGTIAYHSTAVDFDALGWINNTHMAAQTVYLSVRKQAMRNHAYRPCCLHLMFVVKIRQTVVKGLRAEI